MWFPPDDRIVRYIIGTKLYFGGKVTAPVINYTFTAFSPPNNRIKLFNSFKELSAGLNVNGSVDYLDTKKNPVLTNVILEQSTINDLMTGKERPYEYCRIWSFNMSAIINGKRKYFMYDKKQMFLWVNYSTDKQIYYNYKNQQKLENACNEFLEKANRNAREIGALSKNFQQLPKERQDAIRLAVINHKETVKNFIASLPKGFSVEMKDISVAQYEGMGFLPAIPVIVWIVAIITTGVVITAVTISDHISQVQKQKNQLEANYASIQQLKQAQVDVNNKVITQDQYNDQKELITKNVNTGNKNLTTWADADAKAKESGGILGEVKQILIIGAAVWAASKIFPKGNG